MPEGGSVKGQVIAAGATVTVGLLALVGTLLSRSSPPPPTPTPTPTPAPLPSASASVSPSPSPSLAPLPSPLSPQQPPRPVSVSIGCPASLIRNTPTYAAVFLGDWYFPTKSAQLTIEYGDGRTYATVVPLNFESAYRHLYREPGTFEVVIRVSDAAHRVASAHCSFTWART